MGSSLSPAPAGPVDASAATLPPLRVEYADVGVDEALRQRDVLAVVGFGDTPASADPRHLHVPLEPAADKAPIEIWRSRGRIEAGADGALRWSSDGDYAFVSIELGEREAGGIAAATQGAYVLLNTWCARSATPHLLRVWNFVDAINLGDGDEERYRLFCAGRAAGLDAAMMASYPAASAIGMRDGRRHLHVCALATRHPGVAIENPRQVSAWRYPRQYGPVAPNFARAMRAPTLSPQLYISGTAAVVGHASRHGGDVAAQVEETLANVDSLRVAAAAGTSLGGMRSALRAYVRHAADAALVRERVLARLGADTPLIVLLGDICRAELLVEIDGLHLG